MELALSALRVHRSDARVCFKASVLLLKLCFDVAPAIKAKQLGALPLLQAALKAHRQDEKVQRGASAALARIQEFIDAACARAVCARGCQYGGAARGGGGCEGRQGHCCCGEEQGEA